VDAGALRELIGNGPLLADGGMGTSLIDHGVPIGACFEELNVSEPDLVRDVHRGFIDAGARLVLTNTFGCNRFRLERHGAGSRVRSFAEAAVAVARRADAEIVGGSMGPLGVRLAPYGRVHPEDAFEAYHEQASALVAGGADLVVIETQTDVREMEQALGAVRSAAPDLAVMVSATFTRDDRTLLGSSPEEVAIHLGELGADAVGVNCGEGPAQVLRVVHAMQVVLGPMGIPVVARPNAGGPQEVGGRFVYPATPTYFAEHARSFLDEGVAVVGGCCGTGPAHTRAMASALASSGVSTWTPMSAEPPDEVEVRSARALPTSLEQRLSERAFIVAVEMEPPRSFSTAKLVAAAETLAAAGADVIDVADSPLAKMRMSAWAVCRLIQERAGIETVLHFPTRGRNLLRLQGDLLGAHALGIRNLFVCVGDPVAIGDFPQGSNAVDVTATGVLRLITEGFNRGMAHGGASIGEPTSFFVGAAVAPASSDLERECRLLERKVRAGARFLLSQPVFDVGSIARLRETFVEVTGSPLSLPVIGGVVPLVTARHAEFLHNEVPGVRIPQETRDRMRDAGEDGWKVGVEMAVELVASLRELGEAGVYVVPQFGRFDLAAEVVDAARAGDVGHGT
jgi:homocysteine S-methyltransferase